MIPREMNQQAIAGNAVEQQGATGCLQPKEIRQRHDAACSGPDLCPKRRKQSNSKGGEQGAESAPKSRAGDRGVEQASGGNVLGCQWCCDRTCSSSWRESSGRGDAGSKHARILHVKLHASLGQFKRPSFCPSTVYSIVQHWKACARIVEVSGKTTPEDMLLELTVGEAPNFGDPVRGGKLLGLRRSSVRCST